MALDIAQPSSPPQAFITFSLCPLRSAWPSWWPSFRRCGTGPATRSTTGSRNYFGNLLLINVAVGVVTGLVQEFQFGMDWAAYSKFVGDVFGAPLAMEGLMAFFLESTFWYLDFRLGSPTQRTTPHLYLAGFVRNCPVRGLYYGRQLLDAASCWLRHE